MLNNKRKTLNKLCLFKRLQTPKKPNINVECLRIIKNIYIYISTKGPFRKLLNNFDHLAAE